MVAGAGSSAGAVAVEYSPSGFSSVQPEPAAHPVRTVQPVQPVEPVAFSDRISEERRIHENYLRLRLYFFLLFPETAYSEELTVSPSLLAFTLASS